MPAITIDGVSKRFMLSTNRATNLADAARNAFSRRRHDEFWALKDVSFEVEQGQALGIIGHNGAGKSTMLKLLTRIMKPTHGSITTVGRVSALIEVGAGFHPEMTGRENIFLNGSILGMSRQEIKRKLDDIISFAELEQFIDTPVKRYSSGMYARLGFAVAAHVDPEILIVDEVLAVGDVAFQKKCLGKMGEVRDKEGRTVLFVSHNMIAIQSLCQRAILLEHGQVVDDGPSRNVVARMLGSIGDKQTERMWDDIGTAPGNESVRLHRACVRMDSGVSSDLLTVHTPFVMEFDFWNLQPGACLNLSLHVYDDQGTLVFNTFPWDEPEWHGKPFPAGLFRSVCHVPGDLLNDGTYMVEVLVVRDQGLVLHRETDILRFDVNDTADKRGGYYGKLAGVVRPSLKWSTQFCSDLTSAEAPRKAAVTND